MKAFTEDMVTAVEQVLGIDTDVFAFQIKLGGGDPDNRTAASRNISTRANELAKNVSSWQLLRPAKRCFKNYSLLLCYIFVQCTGPRQEASSVCHPRKLYGSLTCSWTLEREKTAKTIKATPRS
ncbi:unnamed protein product [Ectocarpus fasciculatus]